MSGTEEIRVGALWRYPVKSLRGQEIAGADIGFDGVPGDRLVHVRDTATDRVVTARTRPGLLGHAGGLDASGRPTIDGRPWDAAESRAAVRAAAGPSAELVPFTGPDIGQRYDVLPLTVLATGMVEAVGEDFRRFRPNILLTGATELHERSWPGHALRIGDALIGVLKRRSRCVITTFDPDTLEQDPGVLRRIATDFDGCVALDCWVLRPGAVVVGDDVEVVPMPAGTVFPEGNAARGRRR